MCHSTSSTTRRFQTVPFFWCLTLILLSLSATAADHDFANRLRSQCAIPWQFRLVDIRIWRLSDAYR